MTDGGETRQAAPCLSDGSIFSLPPFTFNVYRPNLSGARPDQEKRGGQNSQALNAMGVRAPEGGRWYAVRLTCFLRVWGVNRVYGIERSETPRPQGGAS